MKKDYLNHFKSLHDWAPADHLEYLVKIKEVYKFEPEVVYDIGSCVLHWTKKASSVWPKSKFYLFEAMDTVKSLYDENNYEYSLNVLSDTDNKEVIFYQSDESPGGNSYYKEQSWATDIYYGKESERLVKTKTLDTVVSDRNFKLPQLIKIDVQGSEIDILKGATKTLSECKHLIIELQHTNYNVGAPTNKESIPFIESLGFKLERALFCNNGPDGDYHFIKV